MTELDETVCCVLLISRYISDMIDIELKGVVKEFTRLDGSVIRAVAGVAISIERGEVFGLLGPNGAGKTTTLRMISTVLSPTEGKILVRGIDSQDDSQGIRQIIGFLSGSTGLYKRLTAREMIEYFGKLYGMSEDWLRERTDYLIEMLELGEYEKVLCEKLSAGNKQKVSIARSIVHDPPVMVFDEPTTGLDVMIAENVLSFIESLKDTDKTMIFSTHIMEEAERICDRIGLIQHGRILACGTKDELFRSASEIAGRNIPTLREVFMVYLSDSGMNGGLK